MTYLEGVRRAVLGGLVILLLAGFATNSAAQDRPRVAVLDFENRSGWWTGFLEGGAADVITTKLVESGNFTVVDRSRMADILAEQNLQMTGAVDPATAGQLGRILGVEYLVAGSLTSFSIDRKGGSLSRLIGRSVSASIIEASVTMNVRMINTENAAIVAAADADGSHRVGGSFSTSGVSYNASSGYNRELAGEALGPTAEELVDELIDQTRDLVASRASAAAANVSPPAIVGERNGSFYIDQGENLGVTVGQKYEVMRVVDEIVGSDGTVLDVITERVGVIQVDQVLSQSSVCSVIEGVAAEGDALRPISD